MKYVFYFLFAWLSLPSAAQGVLQGYVATGLASNEGLRQQQLQLETALLALREARARFAPAMSLQGNYFLAGGGRTVDFPAGDLLNPVYSTLNQLTGSNAFPQLQNASILLNPNNFYDVRLHTTIPLLNAELNYLQRIRKQAIPVQQAALEVYRQELVQEISLAYLRWLQAGTALAIYENALVLAAEGERVQKALLSVDKANQASVSRAQSEYLRYAAEREAAQNQHQQAALYFNFLLNRPLNESILVDSGLLQLPLAAQPALQASAEWQQLQAARNLQNQKINLTAAYRIPRLNAFVDLGSQAFDWQYNNQSRYYFAGVAFQWDLFAGGQNRHKMQTARVEAQQLDSRLQELEQQMRLRRENSLLQLQASKERYTASQALTASAARSLADAQKLFREGQLLLIELLDAQNQYIQAQLQQNLRLFDCRMAQVQAERAAYSLTVK